ncbi:MAG TPA: hypothetical protein VM370_09940 [Candidatus Thermoplasmatota archaeon]|nr:hypothetical protein [Candidatus Thermoplasmatota archaeon]
MIRGAWAWGAAYVAGFGLSAILALTSAAGGNAAFVAGALLIVASVFFIGIGGERRMRIVRGLMGSPIAADPIEPEKRQRQISTGVKVFLLGVAVWTPLIVLAWR